MILVSPELRRQLIADGMIQLDERGREVLDATESRESQQRKRPARGARKPNLDEQEKMQ